MLARDLISESLPPLKTSDTGKKALQWMGEFHVTHLPIVNKSQLLGLISEADILDMSKPEEPLGNHALRLDKLAVPAGLHIYEVLKVVSDAGLSVMPVVDDENNYIGIITLQSLLKHFASVSSIQEPGGIITLELEMHDYSLQEVARLVEENSAVILSIYVNTNPDTRKLELTMKLNKTELKYIIATFERFGYTIKHRHQSSGVVESLKDRYDSLMKYLDI